MFSSSGKPLVKVCSVGGNQHGFVWWIMEMEEGGEQTEEFITERKRGSWLGAGQRSRPASRKIELEEMFQQEEEEVLGEAGRRRRLAVPGFRVKSKKKAKYMWNFFNLEQRWAMI